MATAQTPIIYTPPKQRTFVDYLFILIFGGGALWLGKNAWDKYRAGNAAKNLDKPEFQAASNIYNAKGTFADDEESAISVAKDIAKQGLDWKEVSKAFAALYTRNINEYLNSFMDANQQKRFFNAMNYTASSDPSKPKDIKSEVAWKAGNFVRTKSNANIRKTPKWVDTHSTIYLAKLAAGITPNFLNNLIATAPIGSIVGVVTDRKPSPTSFDEKAEPKGVLFLEVFAPVKDKNNNVALKRVWVAASQVEQITKAEYDVNPASFKRFSIPAELYAITASLSGAAQPDYNKEIVALGAVDILNNKMEKVMDAPAGMVLGYPIMEMNTGKKNMVKFQTIAGFAWWTDKSKVKEINLY